MSTKMAKFEASQLEFTHSITDSAGTSWCYGLIKRHEYATQESIKMLAEYGKKFQEFQRVVFNAEKKLCFEVGQASNKDEVSLHFSILENKTVKFKVITPA